MTIKIFGHKAPDTDATCAPIVWSEYLRLMKGIDSKPYVLGAPNTEAQFVLKRWGFEIPELIESVSADDDVIVVDTNNFDELPDGINEANILKIIDHHKLFGGLKTAGPVDMTIRPLASTISVMTTLISEPLEDFPENVLGLMLSCVLSDTLEFRSPTTTDFDRELGAKLADMLGLDMTEYANQMFAAKSDVSHFSPTELLKLDSKIVDFDGKRVRIAVLETTTPGTILHRKDEIIAAMAELKTGEDLTHVLLFVVDILNEQATLFVPNEGVKAVAEKSFGATVNGDTVVLPGIVSRKKQIVPVLKV